MLIDAAFQSALATGFHWEVALLRPDGSEVDAPSYARATMHTQESTVWFPRAKEDWGAVRGYAIYLNGNLFKEGSLHTSRFCHRDEQVGLNREDVKS